MALLFNADTEKVVVTQGASIDDLANVTIMLVFRPTALDGSLHHVFMKAENYYIREGNGGAGRVQFFRDYTGTDLNAHTTGSELTVNEWHIMFAVDNGLNNTPNLFIAQLGSVLVEPTLSTQDAGTTAVVVDNADDLEWGHNPQSGDRSYVGDIAVGMYIAESLTLAQCKMIYGHISHGLVFDTRVYNILGYAGTGTQPDWSGNGNTGAVTGATVADHAPLGPPFGFDAGFPFIAAAVGGLSIPVAMSQYRRQHQNAAWL